MFRTGERKVSYNKFGASQRRSRRLLLSAAGIAVIAGSGSAHAVALETVAEDEIIVTASPLEKTVDETVLVAPKQIYWYQ